MCTLGTFPNHVFWGVYKWVLRPWQEIQDTTPQNDCVTRELYVSCHTCELDVSRHTCEIGTYLQPRRLKRLWMSTGTVTKNWSRHAVKLWHVDSHSESACRKLNWIVMWHILSRHAANWSVMTWHIDMTHCDVTHFESTCRKLKCHDILICHITYQCTYLNWMCHVSKFEIGTHPETTSFVEAINEYCDRDKKVKATCRKLKVPPVNYMCHHTHVNCMCHVTHVYCVCRVIHVNWMWLGSIRLQVSFAKEAYKRDDILQKRLTILSMLLTVATPYEHVIMNMYEHLLIYRVASGSSIH